MKLTDMKLQFTQDLLKKRELYLLGEINPSEMSRITASLLWLNARSDKKEEIKFYINSEGGEAVAGLNMYDALRLSRADITGIVVGQANSMASVVLQACKKRQAMKHTCLLLHTLTVRKSLYELNNINIEKSLKGTMKLQEAIFKILSDRSGKKIREIKKLCEESRALSAEEAKEMNLIDEII